LRRDNRDLAVRHRRDRAEGLHPDHAKVNQALGTEYDTLHGSVLLRVTGRVKPSRAKAYATAFTSWRISLGLRYSRDCINTNGDGNYDSDEER
jgi:hypothetical protein